MTYDRTWSQTFGRARPGATIGRVAHVVVHTEAGAEMPASASLDAEVRRMQSIDAFHRSLGWAGFGYSAAIFPSGRRHEGRGWKRSGAHTKGLNTTALAFVIPGHGDRTPATDACWASGRAWIAAGIRDEALTPDPRISGHRDHAAKSCPGNLIYPHIGRLRGVRGPDAPPPAPPAPPADQTPILGDRRVSVVVAKRWAQKRNATPTFEGMADLYWELAPLRGGVSPEVAYVQAAHETGFGRFGGAVTPAHHNPCGLKVRNPKGDRPEDFQRFASWRQGVEAHVDHLALYAGSPGYPRADTPDPRHFAFLHGTATTVEALTGTWATDPNYDRRLLSLLSELTANIEEDDMPSLEEIRQVVQEEVAAKVNASEWLYHQPRYKKVLAAIRAACDGGPEAKAVVDEIARRLAEEE